MKQEQNQVKKSKFEYDHYKAQMVNTMIDNVLNKKSLIEEQKLVLKDYYRFISSSGKIHSRSSILIVIRNVWCFGDYIKKPYNEATKDHIIDYIQYCRKKPLKENTINIGLSYIKAFYKWYLGASEYYPDIVKWLKPKVRTKNIEYSQLITWGDIEYLMDYCWYFRDRAIVYLLRDIGGRYEETILRPKIKDLVADSYGFRLKVSGKTGERNCRLIKSVPIMKQYLNEHKFRDDPEAPLFYVLNKTQYTEGEPLKYSTIQQMLIRLKRNSNFKKPLNPHNFRKSSATERAIQGFQEKELRILYGWQPNSNMPDLYCNFGEKQVDDKILEKAGKIIKKTENKDDIKFKSCSNCSMENRPELVYCVSCGSALNIQQDKAKYNQEMNKTIQLLMEIANNPNLMKQLEQFKKHGK